MIEPEWSWGSKHEHPIQENQYLTNKFNILLFTYSALNKSWMVIYVIVWLCAVYLVPSDVKLSENCTECARWSQMVCFFILIPLLWRFIIKRLIWWYTGISSIARAHSVTPKEINWCCCYSVHTHISMSNIYINLRRILKNQRWILSQTLADSSFSIPESTLTTRTGNIPNPLRVHLRHSHNHSFTERQWFPLAQTNALWETEFLKL